jgi:hypothetical protein
MLGTSRTDEASESVNRREPVVTGGYRAVPLVFHVRQEATHDVWSEVFNLHLVAGLTLPLGRERKQQGQDVPVARLRIAGQVQIRDDVFEEKSPDPSGDEILAAHGWTSRLA